MGLVAALAVLAGSCARVSGTVEVTVTAEDPSLSPPFVVEVAAWGDKDPVLSSPFETGRKQRLLTDESGRGVFSSVMPGTHMLRVRWPQPGETADTLREHAVAQPLRKAWQEIEVVRGATSRCALTLGPGPGEGAAVSGTLQGVRPELGYRYRVSVGGHGNTGSQHDHVGASPEGHFAFGILPAGPHVLEVHATRGDGHTWFDGPRGQRVLSTRIDVPTTGTLELTPEVAVPTTWSWTATDAETGEPVHPLVDLIHLEDRFRSVSYGRFEGRTPGRGIEFRGDGNLVVEPLDAWRPSATAGEFLLVGFRTGYRVHLQRVELGEDPATNQIEFSMTPDDRPMPRVIDADGEPVTDRDLRITRVPGLDADLHLLRFGAGIATDEHGAATMFPWPPGDYEVTSSWEPGSGPRRARLRIEGGSDVLRLDWLP